MVNKLFIMVYNLFTIVYNLFTIGKYKEKKIKNDMQINKKKMDMEYNYFGKISMRYSFLTF